MGVIVVGLGANVAGEWGEPSETLARARSELEALGFTVVRASPIVRSAPVGRRRQPYFLNQIMILRRSCGIIELLATMKGLERRAGRRRGVRWGPRVLDLDILDVQGLVVRRGAARTRPGALVLPHPEIDRRGFVLVPLAAAAPGWRHPILRQSAAEILRGSPALARGIVKI